MEASAERLSTPKDQQGTPSHFCLVHATSIALFEVTLMATPADSGELQPVSTRLSAAVTSPLFRPPISA